MQTTTGSLTILNAHEPVPSVYWNGVKVEGISAINVVNGIDLHRVILTLTEDPILAEMQAAGIIVRRSTI